MYTQWYPRFQEAYRELGYPNGSVNDPLVEAIDTLLATPTSVGPLAVVQPKVLWEFADPRLEALPAGQKIMLRMGPENADRVKAKLAGRKAARLVQVEERLDLCAGGAHEKFSCRHAHQRRPKPRALRYGG